MSLPKKKKKKKKKKFFFFFFFFFRETPTSPWVPFRAKFRPLGRLFRPSRPLAWSLHQEICPERQEELTTYLISVLQITLYLTSKERNICCSCTIFYISIILKAHIF